MTWQKTVFDSINHTIEPKATCILAVSGGSDSMALLRLMHSYASHTIIVATVDHGLRPSSLEEAHQVKKWCDELNIPHVILGWDGVKPTTGIQQRARHARYNALVNLCREKGAFYLITAHHRDDQIETFFLRLFKGSGPKGLGGMKSCAVIQNDKKDHSVRLLRPFLHTQKSDLLAYLQSLGQDFITDFSNDNQAFERVKLRQMIGDLREKKFNVDAVIEATQRCQQQSTFIDEHVKKHKAGIFQGNHLHRDRFLELNSFLQQTLLRDYLWGISGKDYPPKFHAIERAIDCIEDGATFTLAGHVFKRSTDYYILTKESR